MEHDSNDSRRPLRPHSSRQVCPGTEEVFLSLFYFTRCPRTSPYRPSLPPPRPRPFPVGPELPTRPLSRMSHPNRPRVPPRPTVPLKTLTAPHLVTTTHTFRFSKFTRHSHSNRYEYLGLVFKFTNQPQWSTRQRLFRVSN